MLSLKKLLKRIFKGKPQKASPVRRAYYSGVNFGEGDGGIICDIADVLIFKNNQFVTASIVNFAQTERISDDRILFSTIDKSEFLHIKLSDGDQIDVDINTIIYDPVSQVIKRNIYIKATDIEITSSGDVIVDNEKTKTIVEYL